MKKLIPALAILGSAVAFAVYKMKKDEQKQIMELDQDLLADDDMDFKDTVQKTAEVVEDKVEDKKEDFKNFVHKSEKVVENNFSKAIKTIKDEEEKAADKVEDFTDDMEDKIEDIYGKIKSGANDFASRTQEKVDTIRDAMKEAIEEEEYTLTEEAEPVIPEPVSFEKEVTYHEEYTHLTNTLVDDIKQMTLDAMNSLANDGDVHEHERPVQHMVTFRASADLDAFKNKVINKGFVITKGEGDMDLVVLHISPIDNVKLLSNILYLADQTYANNGVYKGWQSKVSY